MALKSVNYILKYYLSFKGFQNLAKKHLLIYLVIGSVASVKNKHKSFKLIHYYEARDINDLYVDFSGFNN